MPREGKLLIPDLIRGDVQFDWAREQDHVIQRADGSCLYHLASVVDDHDMEISHVIRAEEHLSNTPRQIFIAKGLGYDLPEYAHLPFVAEPGSKVKLSKRKLDKYLKNKDFAQLLQHGQKIAEAIGLTIDMDTFNPVIVDFYVAGRLPSPRRSSTTWRSWVGRWTTGTEHFTTAQLVEAFSLERVNKAPASFDPKKLSAFQEWHMLELPIDKKVDMVLPYTEKAGTIPAGDESVRLKVRQIVEAAGDRIKVAGDIVDYGDFFVARRRTSLRREGLRKAASETRRRGRTAEEVPPGPGRRRSLRRGKPRPDAPRVHRSGRSQRGPDHPRDPGGRHRQGRGLRLVRYPGDPGQAVVPGPNRSGVGDGLEPPTEAPVV